MDVADGIARSVPHDDGDRQGQRLAGHAVLRVATRDFDASRRWRRDPIVPTCENACAEDKRARDMDECTHRRVQPGAVKHEATTIRRRVEQVDTPAILVQPNAGSPVLRARNTGHATLSAIPLHDEGHNRTDLPASTRQTAPSGPPTLHP